MLLELIGTWEGYEVKIKKSQRGKDTLYVIDERDNIIAKRCNGCDEIQYLDNFCKNKNAFAGRFTECRVCQSAKAKKRNSIPEVIEHNKAVRNIYLENNKDKIKEKNRKHYIKNKEYIDARNKAYAEKESSKERALFRSRMWRINNRERVLDNQRNWIKNNITRKREYSIKAGHKRRAKKKDLPDNLTSEKNRLLQEIQGYRCILTNIPASCDLKSRRINFSFEHFIPLSWGAGGTTFENCYYIYLPLNLSKKDRNPFEWIESQSEEIQHNFHTKLVPMLAERNGMTVEAFTSYVNQCYEDYLTSR